MKTILVELIGEELDIKTLMSGLDGSSWKIIEENGGYFLSSEILNSIENLREIVTEAPEILELLNGAVNIFYIDHNIVSPGNPIIIDENEEPAI